MCPLLLVVVLCLLGLVYPGVNATNDCPLPPESILVYFDMEQLSSMMLQHDFSHVFQKPIMCNKENDRSCDNQQCCGDEVGCCYIDLRHQVRKCGCRQKEHTTCTYPAPLAVLGKSECNSTKKRNVVTCLRERRVEQDYLLGRNSTLVQQPVIKDQTSSKRVNLFIPLTDVMDVGLYTIEVVNNLGVDPSDKKLFLQQFTVEELVDNLNHTMIEKLIEHVEANNIRVNPSKV